MANKGKHLIENDYTPVTYDPQYILMVNHLKKYFPIKGGLLSQTVGHVKAVDGVTFNLRRGCTMGLVGESGCGKSTTGRTILRLGGEKTGGQVLFNGKEVYDMTPAEMRELRTKMQIIFQDPFSSLSPRLPVGEIIGEAVREHNLVPKNEFNDYIDQVMDDCGLQPYHKTRYPHEFSGGQRQRICIARALALNPEFVVCDEPVSALDVSIQAQIINLLKSLQEKRNLTYLFISHDLSVVEHISDTVGVMYLGNLVSTARPTTFLPTRCIPTPRRCSRPFPSRTRLSSASAWCCRAPSRPRPTRRPAASSTPAAPMPRSAARPKRRSSVRSSRAITWSATCTKNEEARRLRGRWPHHRRYERHRPCADAAPPPPQGGRPAPGAGE